MDKKEWIAYYVAINGKKPSKKEINTALKDGDILISEEDKKRARKKLYLSISGIAIVLFLLLIFSPELIRRYHSMMSERYDSQYQEVIEAYQKGIDSQSTGKEYVAILEQPGRQPSYAQVDSNNDGKDELYIIFDDGNSEYSLISAYEATLGKVKKIEIDSSELSSLLVDSNIERFNVEKILRMNPTELSEGDYKGIEGNWIPNDGTGFSLHFSDEGLDRLNIQTRNTVENDDEIPMELSFSEVIRGSFLGNFSNEGTEFEFTFIPKGSQHEKSDKNYDRIYFEKENLYFYRREEIIEHLEKRPIDMIALTSGKYSGIAQDYSSIAGKWASLSTPEGQYLKIDEKGLAYLPWSPSNGMQISYIKSYSSYLVGYLKGQNSYSMTISIIPAGFEVEGAENNNSSKDRIAIGDPLDRFNDPQVYYRVE